ncbi:MAG: hypothetical protein IPK26_29325 [Planctomycetes bacterium]|nr:hypothetical protein [Planctomycetota bacterium]
MHRHDQDEGFEKYRKERQRRRLTAEPMRPLGEQHGALRELEEVEQREQMERQLSREVHEFLECATKTAASIVQKVSATARERVCAQLESEMEDFLLDAASRLNHFVGDMLSSRRGQVAEQRVEPHVHNLVGAPLDGFRFAGTAHLADKHIGQDPFATEVEDVSREFRAQMPAHPEPVNGAAAAPDAASEAPAPVEPATAVPEAGVVEAAVPTPAAPAGNADLESFKAMLKDLVKQGLMTRDEARAAWQQRVARVQAPAAV